MHDGLVPKSGGLGMRLVCMVVLFPCVQQMIQICMFQMMTIDNPTPPPPLLPTPPAHTHTHTHTTPSPSPTTHAHTHTHTLYSLTSAPQLPHTDSDLNPSSVTDSGSVSPEQTWLETDQLGVEETRDLLVSVMFVLKHLDNSK